MAVRGQRVAETASRPRAWQGPFRGLLALPGPRPPQQEAGALPARPVLAHQQMLAVRSHAVIALPARLANLGSPVHRIVLQQLLPPAVGQLVFQVDPKAVEQVQLLRVQPSRPRALISSSSAALSRARACDPSRLTSSAATQRPPKGRPPVLSQPPQACLCSQLSQACVPQSVPMLPSPSFLSTSPLPNGRRPADEAGRRRAGPICLRSG